MTNPDPTGNSDSRGSPSLLIVGRLGASALALLSAPIVARAIGPEGRGETAAALALFLIVPVALGLGIPLEVRRQAATSNGHAVIRTARVLLLFSLAMSSAIAAACYYSIFSGFDPLGRAAATIGVVLTPLTTSWTLDVSVLVAHRRYRGVFVMQLLQPAVYVSLILLIWAINAANVATVLAASITATIATFCAGHLLVRVPRRGDRVPKLALVRKGITFFGSAVAEAASSRADQVVALPLIGAYQAGLYSVAATVSSVPFAIGQALGASYFTPIARAEGLARKKLQGEAIRSAFAAGLISAPLVAALAWAAIPLAFGDAFEGSIPVTMVALIGSACLLTAYVASMALTADGRGMSMTTAQVSSLAIGIGSLMLLGPRFGAMGAACASTIGYLSLLALLLAFLQLSLKSVTPRPNDLITAIKRLIRD